MLKKLERKIRAALGTDVSTPKGRFLTHVDFHLFDHAFLRKFWTNFHPIAPGAFRSNQPSPARLKRYQGQGIRTVLNLRGDYPYSNFVLEHDACEALGLRLISVALSARRAPFRADLEKVFDAFDAIEKPFVLHCKSGADRAGFVSALYLIDQTGADIPSALKQLGLRFVHLDFTDTGILDYILRVFHARQSTGTISLRDWVRTEYDRDRVTAGFKTRQSWHYCADALRLA